MEGNSKAEDTVKTTTFAVNLNDLEDEQRLEPDDPKDTQEPKKLEKVPIEEDKVPEVVTAQKPTITQQVEKVPIQKVELKPSANPKKSKISDEELIEESSQCKYCEARSPNRNTKFERSIQDLVSNSIKEVVPKLLSETIKTHVAVKIVQQTKNELSGINDKNYKRIENSVISFAESKIKDSKKIIEDKIRTKADQMIADEINKLFLSNVFPKCETAISEMMEGLFDTVKQSLKENNQKIIDLQKKVDKFITDTERQLGEQSQPQMRSSYQSNETPDLNSIFDIDDKSSSLEAKMNKPIPPHDYHYMHSQMAPKMPNYAKGKNLFRLI